MIVASFTSLILPAIKSTGSFTPAGVSVALGVLLIHLIDSLLLHEHLVKGYGGPSPMKNRLRKAWLLIFALIIHNLPEGLATAMAIGIHQREPLFRSHCR